ncbi:MAG: hypothetical protein V1706_11020 [Pseudomonadota bacterium]
MLSGIKNRFIDRPIPPFLWAFTTYFAEGFPYSLIRTISTFFFRSSGVSLEATGLTSLFGLAWIFKFLWAPYLDSFGTKKKWLLLTQGILVVFFILISISAEQAWALPLVALLFFAASFIASTHDTAIDGYYLEALDHSGQAKFVGYRVMAYRVAMMFGSGVILTLGARSGWSIAFIASTFILALLFFFHYTFLPACEKEKTSIKTLVTNLIFTPHIIFLLVGLSILSAILFVEKIRIFLVSLPLANLVGVFLLLSLSILVLMRDKMVARIKEKPDSIFGRAFISFIDQERIGVIILFIVSVRIGEFMLSAMAGPFFIDAGLKGHYGWITGAVGLPCSIIGAMTGGWLISRYTLKKMIWPFLMAQNLTNITYMALAFHLIGYGQGGMEITSGGAVSSSDILLACGVASFDYLAGGLGTAVLMTFLMGLCKENFKAAHYAIGTGLMSVSGVYAGSFSGFLVDWCGYGFFFGLSFIFSLPAMAFILFLPWPAVKNRVN